MNTQSTQGTKARRRKEKPKNNIDDDPNEDGYNPSSLSHSKRGNDHTRHGYIKKKESDSFLSQKDPVSDSRNQNMKNIGHLSMQEGDLEVEKELLQQMDGKDPLKRPRQTNIVDKDEDPFDQIRDRSTRSTPGNSQDNVIHNTQNILQGLNESLNQSRQQTSNQSQPAGLFNQNQQPGFSYIQNPIQLPPPNSQQFIQPHSWIPQNLQMQANIASAQQLIGQFTPDVILQLLQKLIPREQLIPLLLANMQNLSNSQPNINQMNSQFYQQPTSFNHQQNPMTQQQQYNPQFQQPSSLNTQTTNSNPGSASSNMNPQQGSFNSRSRNEEEKQLKSNPNQQAEDNLGVINYQKRRYSNDEEEEKFNANSNENNDEGEEEQQYARDSRQSQWSGPLRSQRFQKASDSRQQQQSVNTSKKKIGHNQISSLEKEELKEFLRYGRMLCVECKDSKCEYIHTSSICENLEDCEYDCGKAHFSDILVTLINTSKQFISFRIES